MIESRFSIISNRTMGRNNTETFLFEVNVLLCIYMLFMLHIYKCMLECFLKCRSIAGASLTRFHGKKNLGVLFPSQVSANNMTQVPHGL